MDCNKDEAIRAKELALRKMEKNDFEGARRIALKAQNLYPELDNIAQVLSICEVHCSAQRRLSGSEKDWYEILQVEKLADEQAVRKQYRRLALTLHPDKNRFPGAEGAFKLISEANALLADPTKKSLYDNKIRALTRSSQPNSSARQAFWTCCPHCRVRYQFHRQYINRSLHCPTCEKLFILREVSAQGVSPGSKSDQQGPQQPAPMPSKPFPGQRAGFQEKAVPNPANYKMGVQNVKVPSASHTGSRETASQKTVTPEPGVRTGCASEGVAVASAAGNLKTEETIYREGGKEGVRYDDDTIYREGVVGKKSRKRGRKPIEECSDSFDSEIEDRTNDLKSESSDAQFVRRSSRQRHHVSYEGAGEDDHASSLKRARATEEDKGMKQKDDMDIEDSGHGNQRGFFTAADQHKYRNKEMGVADSEESLKRKDPDSDITGVNGSKSAAAADTAKIESDSQEDLSSWEQSDPVSLQCPDAEFSDFDKVRDESNFGVNQFWACYDTLDGMPRFYARVKKVSSSPFELKITWLEADAIDDTFEEWVEEGLPAACGSFKTGQTETALRLSFSHQVHCEKGKKRGYFTIYPRDGEIWALFRDWDKNWSSDPENHKEFNYEIVEVLSDFVAGIGIKVNYLNKVPGFVCIFERASQNETDSFLIGPDELYKFSHRVPHFKMTGTEKQGVPVGSVELDPACLPLTPDDLYYPSKAEMAAEEKGKSVASEGPNTPKKFLDLEGIKRDESKLRRSPGVVNVSKQNID